MAPMTTLRRAALLGCVTFLAASVARAQVEPPPATSPPPTAPAAPPAASPAPPPAAEPAPSAPVEPLSPTMAPNPAAAPPLVLSERTEPMRAASRPEPIYRKVWFWGAVGVVVATVALILIWNLSSNENGPPDTTFGNMNAF
jgi:hypothetical protein